MSKLFSHIATTAAAAALISAVGVASASAATVTRTHESDGEVVSIQTSNIAAVVGTTSKSTVAVSVSGPYAVRLATEKFLTAYGWGDSQWDGLSFASYGCWGRTLSPGQSCTTTIAFTPTFLGNHNESYMLESSSGNAYGGFTATGLRYQVISANPGLLLAS
jgi:hypothetical protein